MNIKGTPSQIEQYERAKEIYSRIIVPTLADEDENQIVAIDLNTEDFEIGEDGLEICFKLKSRHPDADIVGFRLGLRPVDSFRTLRVGPIR